MKRKQITALSIVLAFSLLLSACTLFGPGATPTVDPVAQQATVDAAVAQAIQAISAAQTSTAASLPTSTFTVTATQVPPATSTPEPTATIVFPTAANTLVPVPPKPTATATPADYACNLLSTAPKAGTKIKVDTDFDATWKVKNVGTKVWEIGYLDLRYVSGTKMQTGASIYDVSTAVAVGGDLTLVVDMHTPIKAGKYSATWELTMNGTVMCTLPVNIEAVTP
jgi:hypothetical protein